jgi:hypothetical protein
MLLIHRRRAASGRLGRLATVLAIDLLAVSAGATINKDQCVDANTLGQSLKLDGKLVAAREQFVTCSDPHCPGLIRDDCARRLRDLDRVQPTIIFQVVGAAADVAGTVQVSVDGRPLADRLDGAALNVDPGEHTFEFMAAGGAPVTRRLTIKEGEKDRREPIVLGAPIASVAPTPAAPVPVATAPPPPPITVRAPAGGSTAQEASGDDHHRMGTQKVLGLATGSVGLVGIAVGSAFGLATFSASSSQNSACAGPNRCMSRMNALSDHSTAVTDGAVSTAAFLAGGALLVTGVTLFLTASRLTPARGPSASGNRALGGWYLQPMAGPSGGGLLLRGEL